MPVIEQSPQSEYIEKFLKALKPYLPPLPKSPSTEETREAWRKVYTEPYPGMNLLPFAPNINLNALAKAIYGTASNIFASDPTMGMVNPLSIRAFHGSPYKFSKFENKAIGTGEGAQAFGYGHYLSESPEVAKSYARPQGTISGVSPDVYLKNAPRTGNVHSALEILRKGNPNADIEDAARFMQSSEYKSIDIRNKIAGLLRDWNDKGLAEQAAHRYYPKEANEIINMMEEMGKSGEIKWSPASIYETTIHKGKQPGEYTYLEWDKPITGEQVNKIGKTLEDEFGFRVPGGPAIESIIKQMEYYKEFPDARHGSNIYGILSRSLGSEKKASEVLSKAGFSGIKYPTGTLSGIKGSKDYNYVVFNPEDITIEKILNE